MSGVFPCITERSLRARGDRASLIWILPVSTKTRPEACPPLFPPPQRADHIFILLVDNHPFRPCCLFQRRSAPYLRSNSAPAPPKPFPHRPRPQHKTILFPPPQRTPARLPPKSGILLLLILERSRFAHHSFLNPQVLFPLFV